MTLRAAACVLPLLAACKSENEGDGLGCDFSPCGGDVVGTWR